MTGGGLKAGSGVRKLTKAKDPDVTVLIEEASAAKTRMRSWGDAA